MLQIIIWLCLSSVVTSSCVDGPDSDYLFDLEPVVEIQEQPTEVTEETEIIICDYFGDIYECIPAEIYKQIQEKIYGNR